MAVGDLGIKKIVVCTVSTIVGALLITSLATLYKTGGEKIFPGIYWNMKEETAERIQKEAKDRFDDADKMLRDALANRETINNELGSLNSQVTETEDDLAKRKGSQSDLQSQLAQADANLAKYRKLHDKAKKNLEQANERWRKAREKAEAEREKAEDERKKAEAEREKAEAERKKAEEAKRLEDERKEKHEDVESGDAEGTTTTTTTTTVDTTKGGDKDAQPETVEGEDAEGTDQVDASAIAPHS